MITSHAETIPALDGVRALACLFVVFSHAGWAHLFFSIPFAGKIGVALFFALSGFLMAQHYMHPPSSLQHWGTFLIRRFFRVYPLFFFVLMAHWFIFIFTERTVYPLTTLQNLTEQLLLLRGDSIFWTIVVEMKFYLFFCVLAGVIVTVVAKKSSQLFLLVPLFIGLILHHHPVYGLHLVPYLSLFLGGMIAALIYPLLKQLNLKKSVIWDWLCFFCIICLILSIPRILNYISGTRLTMDYIMAFFSIATPLTVLSAALSSGFLQKFLSSPPMRFLGQISYSIYLTHFFVFILLYQRVTWFPALGLILHLILVLLLAWVSYISIEKPFNQLGKSLSTRIFKSA